MEQVLRHADFMADPLAAIQQHLDATLPPPQQAARVVDKKAAKQAKRKRQQEKKRMALD
jgi:hypothetical protein